ncbi:MAG: GH1 family beta-glucosidase [Anaerolineales bacterium]
MTTISFPKNFLWGVAASAYQIEGAPDANGKGPSIWDTFSHTPGKTANSETGDVAIDHYHRWEEDLDLMRALGVRAYRFSTAWTRILPAGKGTINTPGLDFYDRLVDGCLTRGITPMPCLFHYDLPQALQDAGGGWRNRDTAHHFAEYAAIVTRRLSDRCPVIFTHNEPFVTAIAGYMLGLHAPGERSLAGGLKAAHHVLLSHGLAAEAIRAAARQPVKVGITLNLSPTYPASPAARDARAAERYHALLNRATLDPLLRGNSPLLNDPWLGWLVRAFVRPGDLEHMRNLDVLGVNYYSRSVLRHDWRAFPAFASEVKPRESEYSEMWEIYPPGMYDLLMRIWRDYYLAAPGQPLPELWITENGVPVPDALSPDGQVHDPRRIRYLRDHLAQVRRAMNDGVDVRGYFVWSFADNCEWALGYGPRFGLVYVDYQTLRRTVKDSGRWYAQVIAENGFELET